MYRLFTKSSTPATVVEEVLNCGLVHEVVLILRAKSLMAYYMAALREEHDDLDCAKRTFKQIDKFQILKGYRSLFVDPDNPNYLGIWANRVWMGHNIV